MTSTRVPELEEAAVHHRAGRLQQAETLYRQVLSRDPGQPDALYLLGLMANQFGHHAEAVGLIGRAIENRPTVPQFHITLGQVLAALQRHDEAIAALRQAAHLDPGNPEAHNGLGILLDLQGERENAVDAFRRAIAAAPEFAAAHFNLGNTLHEMGQPEQAVNAYRTAAHLDVSDPEIDNNLGIALLDLLDVDAAIEAFDRALALAPGFAKAQMNKGLALLLSERFDEGWRAHEYRHEASNRKLAMPRPWSGQPLAGKTLFVHSEQGLGDTVNFVRYLPLLAAQGARITMRIDPRLLELFSHNDLAAEFVTEPGGEDAYDYQVALLSIPAVLGTRRDSIPGPDSYLEALPEKVRAYRQRYFQSPGFKVGFVWQGNPEQGADRQRSMPLSTLLPLLRMPGVQAYSLQKGEIGERQLAQLPGDVALMPLGHTFNDLADTAAALANLDLLISTCTSVPHLAGALGTPTWIMLAHHPDWRWFLDDESSPWYRSVRLFRQPRAGDWEPVITRIGTELAKMTG